jgi:hypothetical protein
MWSRFKLLLYASAASMVLHLCAVVEARASPIATLYKECPIADVQSLITTIESAPNIPPNPAAEIRTVPSAASAPSASPDGLQIVAVGPVLGAMDSLTVHTDVRCSTTGIGLRVVLTRSAQFYGDVTKNAPWRPLVVMTLQLKRPVAALEVVWKMRLTTGTRVTRATTPGYREQHYPIVLTKNLTASER